MTTDDKAASLTEGAKANPQRRQSVEHSELKPDENSNRGTSEKSCGSENIARSDAIRPSSPERSSCASGEIADEVSTKAAPVLDPSVYDETDQHLGAAPDSMAADPFNCPTCGAHDYGLFAGAMVGCPHCLKNENAKLRAECGRLKAQSDEYREASDNWQVMCRDQRERADQAERERDEAEAAVNEVSRVITSKDYDDWFKKHAAVIRRARERGKT